MVKKLLSGTVVVGGCYVCTKEYFHFVSRIAGIPRLYEQSLIRGPVKRRSVPHKRGAI